MVQTIAALKRLASELLVNSMTVLYGAFSGLLSLVASHQGSDTFIGPSPLQRVDACIFVGRSIEPALYDHKLCPEFFEEYFH